jgi:transcription termination factor Rho
MFCISTVLPVRGGATIRARWPLPIGATMSMIRGERYFALLKVNTINFENPDKIKHKVHFDNLTPLLGSTRGGSG